MRSNFVLQKLNYVGLLKRKILYKPFIKLFCPQKQEYAHSYTKIIEKIRTVILFKSSQFIRINKLVSIYM